MVRYQSSDTDSSTEDSSSSTDFSHTSSSEDESPNNANNYTGHLRYEDSSDGGRDKCQCAYDYRGELDEIFCPRCRKEVGEYYNDEDEDWYIQPLQEPIQPPRQTIQEPVSVKTQIVPRDSDDSFDSWPSGDEEEITKNGQMKCFRLSKVVKADLELLTGCGLVSQEEYDGDYEENMQNEDISRKKQKRRNKPKRRKRLTKKKYSARRRP